MGTVFFSWQSDRSTKMNKNFIFNSLEKALRNINKELKLLEPERGEPSLLKADQDTQDVPGHPDIFSTILAKIDESDVFVPDFSLIAKTDAGKCIPNPNVMIEYGYALKVLGPNRIVPIMNSQYGDFSNLPFDLRTKRAPLSYMLDEDADPETVAQVRDAFVKGLVQRIKSATAEIKTHLAIEIPNPTTLVSKYIDPLQSTIHMMERDTHGGLSPISGMFIIVTPSGNWNDDKLQIMQKVKSFLLRPFGRIQSGFSQFRWPDGVEIYERLASNSSGYQREEEQTRKNFTKVLYNGTIFGFDKFVQYHPKEKLDTFDCRGIITPAYVEKYMIDGLKNFLTFYKEQSTFIPPIHVVVGLYNIYGHKLALPSNAWSGLSDRILQGNIVSSFSVTSFSDDVEALLAPFFKDVWIEANMQPPSSDIMKPLRDRC